MRLSCANTFWLTVLSLFLAGSCCTGCFRPATESSAMRISSVDPLTEPEFDAFASRIAGRLTPLAQTASGQPAKLAAPQIVVAEEAWRPSARYFSYALMDGLSDRTGGTIQFGRASTEAVQYRTMLMFSLSKSQPEHKSVEFVVLDASGAREILRESAESSVLTRPPEVASAEPGRSTRDTHTTPPPPDEPPADSRPPPRIARRDSSSAASEPQATTPAKRSGRSAPPPPQPRDEPRAEPQSEPVAEARIAPPQDAPASVARPIEKRKRDEPVEPGEIEIDAAASEIGRQIQASAALYARRTMAGGGGRVILLDDDTLRSFAVAAHRAAHSPRGQLQTQLTLVCGPKARDVEYRVVFYDESGEPVSATPVLTAEFERGASKRITITAGDSRAAQYVWLVQED